MTRRGHTRNKICLLRAYAGDGAAWADGRRSPPVRQPPEVPGRGAEHRREGRGSRYGGQGGNGGDGHGRWGHSPPINSVPRGRHSSDGHRSPEKNTPSLGPGASGHSAAATTCGPHEHFVAHRRGGGGGGAGDKPRVGHRRRLWLSGRPSRSLDGGCGATVTCELIIYFFYYNSLVFIMLTTPLSTKLWI